MIFKILLISTSILTFIEINDGMNHTRDTDDQGSLFWSDVDKINKEIHEESSTAEIQNVPRNKKTRLQWAQDIFLHEYHHWTEYRYWYDLRNISYVQSWPTLCYRLWHKHPNTKRGQECKATRFYDFLNPNYPYRVVMPNNDTRYKVDLLQCKCPKYSSLPIKQQAVSNFELYFFVTPCTEFPNSYYIIRQIRRGSLQVNDIRNTTFNPEDNVHVLRNEIDVQTYGQPGITEIQHEPKDEQAIAKWAQNKFLNEFGNLSEKKPWDDLRNKAHENSWSKLCILLLDEEPSEWTEEQCETIIIHAQSHRYMRQRVVDPSVHVSLYADLLTCKCPKTVPFYVTKSYKENNSYYVMKSIGKQGSELEVYDLRCVSFNPVLIP